MLVVACQEAIIDGFDPQDDVAVTLIAGRIGFVSAVSNAGRDIWEDMVGSCIDRVPTRIRIDKSAIN